MKLTVTILLFFLLTACTPARTYNDFTETNQMDEYERWNWYETCTGASRYSKKVPFEMRLSCIQAVLGNTN